MNTIHTAETMSIGKRITLAAVGSIGVAAAALGLAVFDHPGSAAAAPDTVVIGAPAKFAPSCPSAPINPPSNNGKPPHLPQVVSTSRCGSDGSVSGPGGETHDPGAGTIDPGDGTVCVGYEIDIHCHEPV
jgi:hypothetical protein